MSKRMVKDLKQGVITGGPLAPLDAEDAPQYSTVLQGVRNNIIKFDKCVVLTRVGNFYEVKNHISSKAIY